jgi:hypothetical protein
MSLAFITSDPAAAAYDAQSARIRRDDEETKAQNVDAAMRRGLGGVYANSPATAPPVVSDMPTDAVTPPARMEPTNPAPPPRAVPAATVRPENAPAVAARERIMRDLPPDQQPAALAQVSASVASGRGLPAAPVYGGVRPDAEAPGWDRGLAAPSGAVPAIAPAAGAVPAMPPPSPQYAQAGGGGYRQFNPLAGVVAELSRTPGGGAAAMQAAIAGEGMATKRAIGDGRLQAAQGTDRRRAEQAAMTALGKGDLQVYSYWAQRAGINLPDSVLQSEQGRQRVATGSLLAQRFYSDKGQMQNFVRAYMQTGDAMAAATAAGRPVDAPAQWSPSWVQNAQGEIVQMWQNRRDPTQAPVFGQMPAAPAPGATAGPAAAPAGGAPAAPPAAGAPGGQVLRPPSSGAQAREADRMIRLRMLKAAGLDDRQANLIAGGAAITPSTLARVYTSVANEVGADVLIAQPQKAAEVERRMAAFGPNWRQMLAGGLPGGGSSTTTAPPPPAPAAPAAAAPPANPRGLPVPRTPQEARMLPPGTEFMTPDGRTLRVPAAAPAAAP